ncbi:Helix-turn-helix domain-containing protein [Anaerocolumna jejuensis DSM 15929]|uniref:Helix-turn-helix domain-containing protein n=1 Tax=Anaerocolumna jejuensis DSM 15929 TaxID=1121322 RepID=A0A1M6X131_9FIRM|nr:AraC family transcriptional regulator [Anaerocolumna jejuensis]SHK99646.1 Helix-turn-helix domain-containing protein [Anaerocolumna jejuensis DSM 15929]
MITIDYCGYHTHNPDRDVILRPSGTDSYLFLLVLSPMTFYFSNHNAVKAKPGACILYTPGKYQHYQADHEFFNSYVHFFCSQEDIKDYEIKKNRIFYPDNTEELNWLLKKIYQEFINGLSKSEEMTAFYIHQLLILLHRGQLQEEIPDEQRQGIYSELLSLRQQVLGSCEQPWSVEKMCKILNIGKSQLYKYYELFFHSTPKKELVQARLQKAKYLMKNDAVTINQAAYDSGFNNICHFNRLFKMQCGCTPGEYREKS